MSTPTAETVFRDYETNGVPSSGARKPKKREIRQWGKMVEQLSSVGVISGGFLTRAALFANLNYPAAAAAAVWADDNADYNGIYLKSGASGSGSWTYTRALWQSHIVGTDEGNGTANAVEVDSDWPVVDGALVFFKPFRNSVSGALTVSFNGGSALTVRDQAGLAVTIANAFSEGRTVCGFRSGAYFDLINDLSASAAAAAAAASAAQAAAIVGGLGSLTAAVEAAEDSASEAGDSAIASAASASDAEAYALQSELARDASFALGPKYTDEATGRAAVSDGQTFLVVGSGDVAAVEYRRTNSSTSVEIARYPSTRGVSDPLAELMAATGVSVAQVSDSLVGPASLITGVTSGTAIYGAATPVAEDSVLYEVVASMRAGTQCKICVFSPNELGSLAFTSEHIVPMVANSINVWSIANGALPNGIALPAGSYVGITEVSGSGRVGVQESTSGLGVTFVKTGTTTAAILGDVISVVASSLYAQVQFKIKSTEMSLRAEALGAISNEISRSIADEIATKAKIGGDMSQTVSEVFGTASPVDGTSPNTDWRLVGPATTFAGYVRSVSAVMRNEGEASFGFFVPVSGGFQLQYVWTETVAKRLETFLSGDGNMPANIYLPVGSRFAIKTADAGAARVATVSGGPSGSSFSVAAATVEGGIVSSLTSSSVYVQANMTVVGHAAPLTDRLATLEAVAGVDPLSVMVRGPTPLSDTFFPGTATPSGWSLGGWTVNEGLVSPGSGGWSVVAKDNKKSASSRKIVRARFTVINAASVFGICFDSFSTLTFGAACIVDGGASTLSIFGWDGVNAPAGAAGATAALGFSLQANRDYMLEVRKERMLTVFTVTDLVTGANVSVQSSTFTGSTGDRAWGAAGVVMISGSVKLTNFRNTVDCPKALHGILFGDSNLEGSALSSGWASAFGYQAETLRGDNALLVSARGGENSGNLLSRMQTDLLSFRPRHALVLTGTNDSTQSTWRTNVTAIKALLDGLGVSMTLCTLPPNGEAGGATKNAAFNADILSGYFGRHHVFDLAALLSEGNDRVTWNASYRQDDLHANVAGHDVLHAQFQKQCGWFFD
jgi:hypothetical protein